MGIGGCGIVHLLSQADQTGQPGNYVCSSVGCMSFARGRDQKKKDHESQNFIKRMVRILHEWKPICSCSFLCKKMETGKKLRS